jgi:hypothetical protein
MTLPRATALAEVLWSNRNEDPIALDIAFKSYLKKLETHKKMWVWWWNYRK